MSDKETAKCGHLVIDGQGRCESCLETIETEPVHYAAPPAHETNPEELKAEADALTKAWNDLCDRIGKRPA